MTWTASLKQIEKQNGQLHLVVAFNNGTDTVNQDFYIGSITSLKQLCNSTINQLDTLYTFANNTTPGPIDLTPDPVTPPTQAQLDEIQFFQDYARWQKVNGAINMGILTGQETAVVNLKNKVISEFKPAYLADM